MMKNLLLFKLIFSIILSMFWMQNGLTQDLIYSQFYNAPGYLNPALNGQFNGDLRMNLIYRSQWTKVPGALNNYTFSADYQVPDFGGGIGVIINKSSEGTAYLSKLNMAGVYSYSVVINENTLSFGVQGGVTNRRIDYDQLVFPDQINAGGIISGGGTGASYPINNNKYFFDAAAGINYVSGNLMVGISGQHLNRPNESLTGTTSVLPLRYGGYLSYLIPINRFADDDFPAVIPSVVYYNQGKLKSFSAGFQYKTNTVNLGVWYRGDGKQQDAVVLSLIFDLFKKSDSYSKVRVGVSHDATTSKINYTNTGGTTEGAVVFETEFPSRSQARYIRMRDARFNKCYRFY